MELELKTSKIICEYPGGINLVAPPAMPEGNGGTSEGPPAGAGGNGGAGSGTGLGRERCFYCQHSKHGHGHQDCNKCQV